MASLLRENDSELEGAIEPGSTPTRARVAEDSAPEETSAPPPKEKRKRKARSNIVDVESIRRGARMRLFAGKYA